MKYAACVKTEARALLMGRHVPFVLYVLVAYLIGSLAASLPGLFFGSTSSAPLMIAQYLITFLLNVLVSMIWAGIAVAAVEVLRGREPDMGCLFYTFRNQPDHFLVLELIFSLIRTVLQIPVFIATYYYAAGALNILQYLLISLLWPVASEVLYMLITMPLTLAIFLMIEDPSLTTRKALSMSIRCMKGKNSSLFFLYVSFAGMLLLGLASFMIGFLFVYPYLQLSLAIFYRDTIGI